jgi:hypothetical protein
MLDGLCRVRVSSAKIERGSGFLELKERSLENGVCESSGDDGAQRQSHLTQEADPW